MFETILSLFNLVGAINAKKIVCLLWCWKYVIYGIRVTLLLR